MDRAIPNPYFDHTREILQNNITKLAVVFGIRVVWAKLGYRAVMRQG